VAVDAIFITTAYYVIFRIIIMGFIGALVYANLAPYAFVLVSFNDELRFDVAFHFLISGAMTS
jgi:hypothetical protein